MRLRPINGNIIVRPQDAETTTSGGLIIANAENDGIIQGEVLAVGPGEYDSKGIRVEPEVKPGQTIMLHTMAGQSFDFDDDKYQCIASHEIVAILS
jgi:chaperonin GroES